MYVYIYIYIYYIYIYISISHSRFDSRTSLAQETFAQYVAGR